MKIGTAVIFFIFLILVLGCSQSHTNDPFVKVKDLHFEVNGKPYYYLGANVWYGANMGALIEGGNRERLARELDLLKSLGIDNLRVMGASEAGDQHNTVKPPIQSAPGKYNEDVLVGLDFLLDEMGKRDMYAVVFLNNFWVWSGGMAQYVSWFENTPVPNPFLPEYEWHEFMNFSATFYTNKPANESFHQFIKMMIERKNTINGKLYREDPTIMSWQLANEPRPGEGEQGKENFEVFSRWIDETAKYIKSLDSNHLVSTGNEGMAGCMWSADLFREIHSYESIDYINFHLWILNWSWFRPQQAEETYPEAEEKALAYIKEHIGYAREVGKPVVIEEFGIPRDLHMFSPQAPTVYRDKYYDAVFKAIHEDAAAGGPLVGSNFWAWGGYGKARDPEQAIWQIGDGFTGDPPQEPQGRNSVFATDSTTLKILKKYGTMMQGL